ncbi:MAG TPA: hypothetical protein ENK31_09565, partial [Nannocystis exedens]|nr:hypothetical protein [Nannocystis exedens]
GEVHLGGVDNLPGDRLGTVLLLLALRSLLGTGSRLRLAPGLCGLGLELGLGLGLGLGLHHGCATGGDAVVPRHLFLGLHPTGATADNRAQLLCVLDIRLVVVVAGIALFCHHPGIGGIGNLAVGGVPFGTARREADSEEREDRSGHVHGGTRGGR